jgi:allophanate hydrolase
MNGYRSSPAVAASLAAHRAVAGPDAQPIWIQLLSTADVSALAAIEGSTTDGSIVDETIVAGSAASAGDGELAGLPFAIKDNLDLAGYPTTAGCPDLAAGPFPARDAEAVRRLRAAGAVPIGKTNMDQFATGLVGTRTPYGACHSVASRRHVSGGSSSGSAIAVAAGIVPLALGTDTAGSGRVPAAFNGIVGVKPTRGLVSTRGLLPACRSLDCVTTFTRTVSAARAALSVLVQPDPRDPWSRARPAARPAGVAARMRVVAVPDRPLDLEPLHDKAWQAALARAGELAELVPVDIEPFLAAARLLYEGAWLAERWGAFGHLLGGPGVDPTVRGVVSPGRSMLAADAFAALDRLATLRRRTDPVWTDADALLLPVTPEHPTLAEVAGDPVGVNSRLGRFTNFVNLLDLCAVAVPAGQRPDGLPFGVQFIAPAFADEPLLDLAARWCGEPDAPTGPRPGWIRLAVCGAHLSGLPLSADLVRLGGALHHRARTAAGYRMVRLPGPGLPRPGLLPDGAGPAGGFPVEVWELPQQAVGALLGTIPAPLTLGRLRLADGDEVVGFLATGSSGAAGMEDISGYGGWRAYLSTVDAAT